MCIDVCKLVKLNDTGSEGFETECSFFKTELSP